MNLPARLANRPMQGGFPVTFVTKYSDSLGRYDFREVDWLKVRGCAAKHLCVICGEKFAPREHRWFIGGERSSASLCFVDGWMHEECARYSAFICPYINGSRRTYRGEIPGTVAAPDVTQMFLLESAKAEYGFLVAGGTKTFVFRIKQLVNREEIL